jgi:hypothetical protein
MEWETMRNHAQMGAGLLASHESLRVQLTASIAIREQYKDLIEDSIQQQSISQAYSGAGADDRNNSCFVVE